MGKKIMDIKTRRDASRERKSKAGGGDKIKSRSTIYTPVFKPYRFSSPSKRTSAEVPEVYHGWEALFSCIILSLIFIFISTTYQRSDTGINCERRAAANSSNFEFPLVRLSVSRLVG